MKNPAHVLLAEFANTMIDAVKALHDNPGSEEIDLENQCLIKRNELIDMLDKQWNALENCRMLAQRFPKESWAINIRRYCDEAGSVARVIGR